MILNYEALNKLAFGIEYLEEKSGKYFFSRFSEQERELLDYGRDNSFATAGVKLDFITDSKHLNIEVCVENSNPHGRNFYSFDIYKNEKLMCQIKNYNKEPTYPYKNYSFNDRHKYISLGKGIKRITVFFPWSVRGILSKLELDDGCMIKPISKKRKIIMYGDSITQGYDSGMPSHSYAARLSELFDADIINKGIGGSIFMPEITSLKSECHPNLITVAYGTNDWNCDEYENFKMRCEDFFGRLMKNHPKTPVLAIAPIWRADSGEKRKFGVFSGVAEEIKTISQKNKNIYFVDGIDFVPHNKSYYRDGYLHPNDKGFEFYTEKLLEKIIGLNILKTT